MKIPKLLLLVILFPVLLSTSLHKFYVSVTEIEFVKEKKQVQLISRIFIDDFENVLRERYDQHLTLDAKNDNAKINALIEQYLNSKIAIKINGKDVNFKFIGKEYDNDIMFCYLQIDDIKEVKTFGITNRLLFDKFQEQQNIVKFKINSKNKNIILIPDDDNDMLNF